MTTRRLLAILAAMGVGYAPSFLLPFLVAVGLGSSRSDPLLLAIATATTVGSVLALAIENAWAAGSARAMAEGAETAPQVLLRGVRQSILLGILVTAILIPVFSSVYWINDGLDRGLFFVSLTSVLLYPTMTATAAVGTGVLNAHGRVVTNLLLQGLRGVFPIAGLAVALATGWPWVIGVLLTTGELIRAVIGLALARAYCRPDGGDVARPATRALINHIAGLAILGSSPPIDRAFLAAGPVGSITRFEMADRVFFAGSQVSNNVLILPRIGRVARRVLDVGARHAVLGEAARVAVGATAIAVLLGAVFVIAAFFLPSDVADSLPWALTLLVSLPAAMVGTFATRMTVAAGLSHLIPWMGVGGTLLNLGANFAGFFLFGVYGVVLSTVFCRFVLTSVNLLLLVRHRPGVPDG